MHGTRTANYAMDEADLIVAIGARFDDRVTGKLSSSRARVHPHRRGPGRDLEERAGPHPDRGRREEHPAQAHRRVPGARGRPGPPGGLVAAPARLAGKYPLRYDDSADSEIKPQFMVEAMFEATDGQAIVTSDVGQHQMWPRSTTGSPARASGSTRAGWDDGLRPAVGDGRQGRLPGSGRGLPGRRRLADHDRAGSPPASTSRSRSRCS